MTDHPVDYQSAFNALPGHFFILQPNAPHFTILAVSDELLRIINRKRTEVVGRNVFEVYNENPKAVSATGLSGLRTSLQNAMGSKLPDQMPAVRYNLHNTAGAFEERYWAASSKPVIDPEGKVLYIILANIDITDQIKEEKRQAGLRNKEQAYELFIQAPFAIFKVSGPGNNVELANKEFLRLIGRTSDIIGKPLFEVIPEAREQGFPELLNQVRKTGEPFHATEYLTRLMIDGKQEKRYFNFVYQPYYESPEDKDPSGVFCVAYDVTEQVKAQKQVEYQKGYLQNAIDIADLGTFKVDVATNTGTYSETVREWFGLADLSQPMDSVFGKIHPEDAEKVVGTIQGSLQSEEKSRHDLTYRVLPAGNKENIRYLRSIGKALFEKGKPHSIIGIIQDVTPQLTTQLKLEESEFRFRNMVQQAPVAITLTRGRDVVIENINGPMLHIMGKEHEKEVLGKKMVEVIPEVEGRPVLDMVLQVLDTGESFSGLEVPVQLQKGKKLKEHYFNLSFNPLLEEGEVTGVLHVAIDVTEQVRARKKVEEGVKELNNLANAMPQVVWMAEANGKVTYYNDRVAEFAGVKKLPDGSWTWERMLYPADEQPTVEAWEKAVSEGANYEKEHRLRMKDGTYRWHLSRAFPQRDERGIVVKWFGTATDVHEQKENEEALRRSEEQLRIAVEGAELGIFYHYPQEGTLFWSAKTKELMGLPPDAAISPDTFLDAQHPDDKERSYGVVQNAMRAENGGMYENEFRIVRFGDGRSRWMRSKGRVSFDGEGKPIRFTGVTQDITARKESEEALEKTNKQLVRINNDLDNFIYTASHDLKAPINNIEGLMQVLFRKLPAETLATEQVQRISGMMQESVDRFKKTIANLTEVVKLQKEHNEEAVSVNLAEVVREVEMDLEPMIQSSGARLEIDVAGCPSIRFSEKNLRSVVYNLLSNAIKYRSPEREPRVHITCESIEEYTILSVKDNGLGMEKGRIGQLFTMFKRFHAHVEGTGIGLYMVKKMVENAGGHIKVESQAGAGSTFWVYFPR